MFWEEPYSKEFAAKVVSVEGQAVVLDQTLFYPRGGGVACDTGTLNGLKVQETTKANDKILHTLDAPGSLKAGDKVIGRVDWERRHRLMKMHTAGHLLSSLFYSKANCRITGNQIDVDRSRMDFDLESFDRSQIEGYVAEANELIRKDAPVKTYFCNDFGKVVKGCPAPLVVAGGPKLETELDAFQLAHDAIQEGAVGVDMGRNIWQSEHPVPMMKAIREIVHGGVTVREAQEVYNRSKNTKEQVILRPTAAR